MKLLGTIIICSCHSHCDSGMYVMAACKGFGAVRFLGTQDKTLTIYMEEGLKKRVKWEVIKQDKITTYFHGSL